MVCLRDVSVLLPLVFGSLVACSDHHGSGDDDDDDGSGVTLTISPAAATVALATTGAGYAATQQYTVTAKTSSGTKDVTDQVAWDIDDSNLTFDTHGTATVTAAGPYHLVAVYGGNAMATAELDATLSATDTGTGWTDGDQGKLDGAPTGTAPTIAYPLGGALFPVNMTPIEIHTKKSDASQTLARVTLTAGTALDYKFYAPCAPSPKPAAFPDACIVRIPDKIANQLAGASEATDVALTVRLAAADGSKLSESAPSALAWSKVALTGGLYYWTTAGSGSGGDATAIARFDFAKANQPPELFLQDSKVSASKTCIGCHALSPDGSKLSFSMGGSDPSNFSVFDVGTSTSLLAAPGYTAQKFAAMSTFSPDGSRAVTMERGVLTLRTADAALTVLKDNLFADTVGEQVSHPFWGPSGGHLAFVSWTPSANDISKGYTTGDMVQGGQLWISDTDGEQMTGTPRNLVPRVAGVTSYYPAISDDDLYVVFNQSSCAGPANTAAQGWGLGACDGYNDISATLHVVPVAGGAPIALTKANGGDNPLTTNSWPRWSPDHGTFRGKRLYWVAYSSRRAYGMSLVGSQSDTTKPQLWFAAVTLDEAGTTPAADPSFSPVWLPGQNTDMSAPRGNHTPVWTSKVVIIE